MLWKIIVVASFAIGVLADEFNADSGTSYLSAMCKKNGVEDKLDDVMNAGKRFLECLEGVIDFNNIAKEISDAEPKGAVGDVFKKYCAKSPELKACFVDLTTATMPCMDQSVREQMGADTNTTNSLIDFICKNDGEKITLFFVEGGPACFRNNSVEILECLQNVMNDSGMLNINDIALFHDRCAMVDRLSPCLVKALEKCSTPTPANLIAGLLQHVRSVSPCSEKN